MNALRRDNHRGQLSALDWQRRYDAALESALASGDPSAIADVVSVGANRLDSRGRLDAAVLLIDAALVFTTEAGSETRLLLLALKAPFQRALGDAAGAKRTLAEGALLRSSATGKGAEEFDLVLSICQISELTADIPGIEKEIATATRAHSFRREGLLLAWAASYALALGLPARARPWIDVLRAKATIQGHAWRVADAVSLRRSVESRTALGFEANFEFDDTGSNWIALRRTRLLRLHHSLLIGDFTQARAMAEAVESDLHAAGAYRMPANAFMTLVAAHQTRATAEIEPPPYVGLENLGAILAGAEAVAMTGTEAVVDRWTDWFESVLPGSIRSAAEWPTSRARIGALLALRRGNEEQARIRLMEAIEWAEAERYEIEADLARVQLAELTRPSSPATELWKRLRAVRVDPAAAAYWAAACRSRPPRRGELTDRELEVLTLMRDGRSAREAGVMLGVSPKTVANHIQSIYEKLGVHGRAKAVTRARAIGLV